MRPAIGVVSQSRQTLDAAMSGAKKPQREGSSLQHSTSQAGVQKLFGLKRNSSFCAQRDSRQFSNLSNLHSKQRLSIPATNKNSNQVSSLSLQHKLLPKSISSKRVDAG